MTLPTLKRGAHSVASHPPPKLQPPTHKKSQRLPCKEMLAKKVFTMKFIAYKSAGYQQNLTHGVSI
jgi:hypothetical protein